MTLAQFRRALDVILGREQQQQQQQQSNPGRELALVGAAKRRRVRRAAVCAVAQRMREECGLPPHPALK